MTAKHTPGPWLREGQTVYALMHAGWRKGVEQFKNRFSLYVQADKECPDEEHEANVRLIAAAPELLKALQELYSNGHLIHFTGDTPEDCAIKSQAVAAIAKALGEDA